MQDIYQIQKSRSGILFLLSGPAGSGKSTLLKAALKEFDNLEFSISCTTRLAREQEVDGKEYHFLTEDEFQSKVDNDEFLEYANVHKWNYGTLKSSVKAALEKGTDVIMDIDVQGAQKVRSCQDEIISSALVDIFITTKNIAELESRLRGRGSEDDETFELRMETASSELKEWSHYAYCIISGTQQEDFRLLSSIINSERAKVHRMNP
jgi:guanylate kinase|tara:strand:+ start:315 stop:938 length:624 start_codon:yes stop_codon:yes gene_type:complete